MRNQLTYDLPTRFFHWIFTGLFLMAFIIAKTVDDESPVYSYHMLAGLTLSFVLFQRIIWGILGSKYARFSSFKLHPQKLIEYLSGIVSGKSIRTLGHNPASSWAAIIMMILALGLGITGYLMTGANQKEAFEDIHEILANTFVIVVILHVLGVILHSLRHKDMIGLSMIDGKKASVPEANPIGSNYSVVAILFLALTTGFIINLAKNYDSSTQKLNLFGASLQLAKAESGNESREGGREENETENGGDDDND